MSRDFIAIAQRYCNDVLSGEQPAALLTRQAVERQARNLADGVAGYTFDEAQAVRACRFIELLPHIKGSESGRVVPLSDWQVFILATVFGWRDEWGCRRFKTVYVEVPRKNSKSTLTAGVAIYCAFAEGEGGAECYTAATKADQAKIVFDTAKEMARKSPSLCSRFGLATTAHTVYQESSASLLRAVNAEASTLDGLNTHFCCMDELHAHRSRKLWDVIETSMGSRDQALMWAITTSGTNRAGICYEQRTYVVKLMQGVIDDEEYFGIIYTVDAEDLRKEVRDLLFTDERIWRKANPNYGLSVKEPDMRKLARKAQQIPAAQNNFMTKRLNVWVNADVAWMDMHYWDRCADTTLVESDFADTRMVSANDLATVRDLSARLRVYRRELDGKQHYYAFGSYYLPQATVENGTNSQYEGWEQEGRLIVNPGVTTDLDRFQDDVLSMHNEIGAEDVVFDPHQATQMMQWLDDRGVPVSKCAQNRVNFSEPMKLLEVLVIEGRFHHDGCPVLAWNVSNTVANTNEREEIYPTKEREENKIDGLVALIMCMRRWIDLGAQEKKPPNPYETRGLRILS